MPNRDDDAKAPVPTDLAVWIFDRVHDDNPDALARWAEQRDDVEVRVNADSVDWSTSTPEKTHKGLSKASPTADREGQR